MYGFKVSAGLPYKIENREEECNVYRQNLK
jgi:hypothetical protein